MASSLTTGPTLAVKRSQELLDDITHRVGIALEVRNHTKFPMVQPLTFIEAGQVLMQAGDIQPNTREAMTMHKTDHTATGTWWLISS